MIKFDEKTRTFFLHGKEVSYLFRVDEYGYLEHLYFGPKAEDDLSYLNAPSFLSFSPTPPGAGGDFSLDTVRQEYGTYGQGDFRIPAFLAVREDGERASRLLYTGHAFTEGGVPNMPHARGGQTLRIDLKDARSSLTVHLFYTVFDDSDVIVRSASVANRGTAHATLLRADAFSVDLFESDVRAVRLVGRHANERMPEETPLGHGSIAVRSSRGASSHQANPFLALLLGNADEERGECYGFGLIYSGSFVLEAERSQTDLIRVRGGIDDTNFSWELAPNEMFFTPQSMISYSKEGLGGLSRTLSRFLRAHVACMEAMRSRPVVCNNWEATYFDFTPPRLLALIDEAAELGIDTFVLDDGWFGSRNSDAEGLGDWFVNEKKLRGGLAPLIARCRERGMTFGIWFEPEMVSEKSELYRAHPDWTVGRSPRAESRNQYVLDFSRPEVVDYLFGAMENILRCGVGYVKWDMNRHLTEFTSEALPAARQGEFSHRYMLGVYALAERLKAAFPDVFFEGCSGGGGRFDAGMLYYFPQIWTSDNTDAFDRARIEWGTSFAYPLSAMSCHVSACPNHQTGRTTPFSSRGDIASLGATGYELDLGKLTEEEKEAVRGQIARYRSIEPLLLFGDAYRLLDPFRGNYFCMEVVSGDRSRAYVVGMTAHAAAADYPRRVRLRGLDPEKRYFVPSLQRSLTGAALQNAGLLLPRAAHDFETWTWLLEAEE